jgi:Flp pilus assembly protein TadG
MRGKAMATVRPGRRGIRSWWRDEAGATLVETALSLTLLLAVLFGVLEGSLVVYSYHFISEAAREGTRYAAVRGYSTFTTPCTAPGYANCVAQGGPNNAGDIATYVENLGFPGISASSVTVNSTWLTSSGAACGTTNTCKVPGDIAKITVTYTFPFSFPFVSLPAFTMSSTSEMVVLQ